MVYYLKSLVNKQELLTPFRRPTMQANPKTGTMSKFVIATLTLANKLVDIQKHLRDCDAGIVEFAKLFAEHLVGKGPPQKAVLLPWDFVNEWNNACEDQKCAHVDNLSGICTAAILVPISFLRQADKMMPIFAEDLCGKEFAAVAVLYRENPPSPKPLPKWALERALSCAPPDEDRADAERMKELDREAEADRESGKSATFFPFPPEPPVVEESVKKPWANDSDNLSDVERTPRPPENDLGHHGSWDF